MAANATFALKPGVWSCGFASSSLLLIRDENPRRRQAENPLNRLSRFSKPALQIAMLDHMLDGRFNFGISPGGLLSDAEIFGNLDADRNALFGEGIAAVLKIWEGPPPYAIEGRFWKITTERT